MIVSNGRDQNSLMTLFWTTFCHKWLPKNGQWLDRLLTQLRTSFWFTNDCPKLAVNKTVVWCNFGRLFVSKMSAQIGHDQNSVMTQFRTPFWVTNDCPNWPWPQQSYDAISGDLSYKWLPKWPWPRQSYDAILDDFLSYNWLPKFAVTKTVLWRIFGRLFESQMIT